MKMKIFLLIIILIPDFIHGQLQSNTEYLKENAVRIDKLDNLSDSIYNLLSPFKIIMIGEMHGTNEPAKFLIGLTNLFTSKDDSVQVGLEIPEDKMIKYLNQNNDSNIKTSEFFANGFDDGRSSEAWAEIISTLNDNPKARIFFYDINLTERKFIYARDSLMYLNVKKNIQQHPLWKTITISGNAHNMLLPMDGETKMGLYLKEDTDLNVIDKICSINHYYKSGSMLNNSGNGLQLKNVDNGDDFYSQTFDFNNYFFLYSTRIPRRYTGLLFTKNITAAKMVR
jgi:hypothetical protein